MKAFVLGQLDVGYLQRLGKRGTVASQVTELKGKLNFAIKMFQVNSKYLPGFRRDLDNEATL